jgi:hypothetical protein
MISAYERDRRQPTIPTLMRLLKAAGFELSMRLVPRGTEDEVLAGLDSRRSSRERQRRDRQLEAGETQSLSVGVTAPDDAASACGSHR